MRSGWLARAAFVFSRGLRPRIALISQINSFSPVSDSSLLRSDFYFWLVLSWVPQKSLAVHSICTVILCTSLHLRLLLAHGFVHGLWGSLGAPLLGPTKASFATWFVVVTG